MTRRRTIAIALLGALLLAVVHFICRWPYSMVWPVAWLLLTAVVARWWRLVPALVFSLLGDVMGYQGDFEPQMAFFALAQVSYITLFWRSAMSIRGRILIALLCLAVLVCVGACVVPQVPSPLRYAVLVYAILLLTMCGTASQHGILPALGGILFVLSDSLIGIHSFVARIPQAHLLIMIPYYIGQGLLFTTPYLKSKTTNV